MIAGWIFWTGTLFRCNAARRILNKNTENYSMQLWHHKGSAVPPPVSGLPRGLFTVSDMRGLLSLFRVQVFGNLPRGETIIQETPCPESFRNALKQFGDRRGFLIFAHLSFRRTMGFLLRGTRTHFLRLLNEKPDFRLLPPVKLPYFPAASQKISIKTSPSF